MSESKSIILPTFNGKEDAFQTWWVKFRAYCLAKGVIAALMGKETHLPAKEDVVLDETITTDKLKIKARECKQ